MTRQHTATESESADSIPDGRMVCQACNGDGTVLETALEADHLLTPRNGPDLTSERVTCPDCGGVGHNPAPRLQPDPPALRLSACFLSAQPRMSDDHPQPRRESEAAISTAHPAIPSHAIRAVACTTCGGPAYLSASGDVVRIEGCCIDGTVVNFDPATDRD